MNPHRIFYTEPPDPAPGDVPIRHPILDTRIYPVSMGSEYDWCCDPFLSVKYFVSIGGEEKVVRALYAAASIVDFNRLPRGLVAYEQFLNDLPKFGKDDIPAAAEVWDGQREADDPPLEHINAFLLSSASKELRVRLIERASSALQKYISDRDEAARAVEREKREKKEDERRKKAVEAHDKEILKPQIKLRDRARGSQSAADKKRNKVMTENKYLRSALNVSQTKNAELLYRIAQLTKELTMLRLQQPDTSTPSVSSSGVLAVSATPSCQTNAS